MPNNFPKAIPDIKQSMKTISMFKDEYLLDFINTANLGQLCTYLQALDLTVKKPHENPSIGIVLCKEMNKAFVDIVVRNYYNRQCKSLNSWNGQQDDSALEPVYVL